MGSINSILFITSILSGSALAAIDTTKAYQLRISNSQNTQIASQALTLKDLDTSSAPNALGLWLTDRVFRDPYQFTFSSASDSRFYKINGVEAQTRALVWGDKVAMGFYDAPIGSTPEVGDNEAVFDDKFVFMESEDKLFLRHAQDFDSSEEPSGGAGSWRACKGDSVNDYGLYWYDGSSPLPIKECEGVQLEAVAVESSPTASASGIFITGVPAPSSTASGFITGVPAPSGTNGPYLPGVTPPSNASSTKATPTPFMPVEGAGSRVAGVGGVFGGVFGVLALVL